VGFLSGEATQGGESWSGLDRPLITMFVDLFGSTFARHGLFCVDCVMYSGRGVAVPYRDTTRMKLTKTSTASRLGSTRPRKSCDLRPLSELLGSFCSRPFVSGNVSHMFLTAGELHWLVLDILK